MADPKFFRNAGPFSLEELAKIANAELGENVSGKKSIMDVAPLHSAGPDNISFLDNPAYLDDFRKTKAGACLINKKYSSSAPENTSIITSENPYLSYALVASHFYPLKMVHGVAKSAAIHKRAKIGADCYIGENVSIGDGVEIGNNCIINASVSISHAVIGNNVILHHGVCIGQDGFGYASKNGAHTKVPQLGRVIIEDDVEIGANTCVDRGAGPDTVIGAGTKIDNLVQIGHNVKIGKGCIIVAQAGVSGSTVIGDYTVIAGQAGVAGHLKIGKAVQIGGQSGVIRDIADGEKVCGYPSVPIKQWHRQTVILEKLVKQKTGSENDKN